jgi:predicted amidohydrolase
MKVGLVQLNGSDDPDSNLLAAEAMIAEAAVAGAGFVLTPEMTNLLTFDRDWAREVTRPEAEDPGLARLRRGAVRHQIWLLIGSLAIRRADGRLANRSFLIDPEGNITARYDKIHMFDVKPGDGQEYRESSAYAPGDRAVVAATPFGPVGMAVCYDLRFPALFTALARSGAGILTVPAAFTVPTGQAHWHVLLRARAIENAGFVLAPAQCGENAATHGRSRRTYGHSLIVSPWGEVLADGGDGPGVVLGELDLDAVARARRQIPVLDHHRTFEEP